MLPFERLATLRILDANYNRAGEGLRVVEEYCRMALGDRHLSERCKQVRHRLTEAYGALPAAQRLAAREAQSDVGADLTTPQESRRGSLQAIAAASCARVEQALRAIEEYGKLISPPLAEEAKRLRFEVYTLAKACLTTMDSQERLAGARLYVLIDGGESREALTARVAELVAAGVHAIQLRDKTLDDRELLMRARIVRDATAGAQTLFIMNDRPDLAVLSRADCVHVGQEELSVAEVRQIVGPEMLVGVSTHSIEQARQAVLDGANYVGCGPTFPSDTKAFAAFPGLEFLQQVAAEISLPAFAIGGITLENVGRVLATGLSRVAVGAALRRSPNTEQDVQDWLEALNSNPSRRIPSASETPGV